MGRDRALWALLLAGLAGFVALAIGYEHDPLATADRETAEWVAASLPEVVEWAARPLSWLGGLIGLTVLGIVAGVLLVRERAWLDLAFFLTAFVGSQLAASVIKDWFDRPRPDAGAMIWPPTVPRLRPGSAGSASRSRDRTGWRSPS